MLCTVFLHTIPKLGHFDDLPALRFTKLLSAAFPVHLSVSVECQSLLPQSNQEAWRNSGWCRRRIIEDENENADIMLGSRLSFDICCSMFRSVFCRLLSSKHVPLWAAPTLPESRQRGFQALGALLLAVQKDHEFELVPRRSLPVRH